MIRKSEYHCLPHAAAVEQMQAVSILRRCGPWLHPAMPQSRNKSQCAGSSPAVRGVPIPPTDFSAGAARKIA